MTLTTANRIFQFAGFVRQLGILLGSYFKWPKNQKREELIEIFPC